MNLVLTLIVDIAFELDAENASRLTQESGLVMVMPYTDADMARRAAQLLARRAACDGLLLAVQDAERAGFIGVANRIFRASNSALFGYVAQDAFAGREWGKRVIAAFREQKHGLLGFNDGKWSGLLAAFGVARRAWAEQNYAGDLFFAGYTSHYADVELTLLALEQGAYAYDPNCVMIEVDYEKEGKPVNPTDQKIFTDRKHTGFDRKVSSERLLSLFS
ncbi:MAG: hypothetical protein WC100_09970 [Sterolibacterium sp.]